MPSKKFRNILLLCALAAVLVAVGYWNISPERLLDPQAAAQADPTQIDYYATNAHTVQFNLQGTRQYEMTGNKVEHMKVSQITYVTTPDVYMYRGTEFPWHIQSVRAEVNPDGTQVELIENVRVARTDEKKRTTIITGPRMTVFPQKQYAQTEQNVRIEAAGSVTTATGMKAYLNDSRMNLLSNVRGQYEAR
jgi:lipopolysaccharide export system protein LptC